jgi:hypothetical protein
MSVDSFCQRPRQRALIVSETEATGIRGLHIVLDTYIHLCQRPRQRPLVSLLLSLSLCVRDRVRGHLLCQRQRHNMYASDTGTRGIHNVLEDYIHLRQRTRQRPLSVSPSSRSLSLCQRPVQRPLVSKTYILSQRPTYCVRDLHTLVSETTCIAKPLV